MRNDLLSIGEVSKLKGVGVKALRYYERIGILSPAFVDEHTGYRYYDLRQMNELDVIMACVELGIPLKELKAYRSERGALDLITLLERGRMLAWEQLRRAQANLLQIDAYCDEMILQRTHRDAETPYTRRLEPCTLLALPWEGHAFDARRYVKGLTTLYEQARASRLVPLYLVGMARLPNNQGTATPRGWQVVLQVRSLDGELSQVNGGERADAVPEPLHLVDVPGGAYRGARVTSDSFENCFNAVFTAASASPAADGPVLAHELWDDELRAGCFALELLSFLPERSD